MCLSLDLLNDDTLAKCKKGVRIINVARGGIVDENALLKALQSGHVSGAGLDVFVEEPPKNTQLVTHPKVVCTPHLGASTKEAQNNVAKEIALQFLDIMDNKSVPGVVNAPLLAEVLQHQNIIWIMLGKALGRLAATHSSKAKQFTVTVSGPEASEKSKLIKESVLMGIMNVHTKTDVNIISASGLADDHSISVQLTVEKGERCCHSVVSVTTDTGNKYVGSPQGRRCYLSKINEETFEPPVLFSGTLTLFQPKSQQTTLSVMTELLKSNSGNTLQSTTRTVNNMYAIHSQNSFIIPDSLQAEFVTELKF